MRISRLVPPMSYWCPVLRSRPHRCHYGMSVQIQGHVLGGAVNAAVFQGFCCSLLLQLPGLLLLAGAATVSATGCFMKISCNRQILAITL